METRWFKKNGSLKNLINMWKSKEWEVSELLNLKFMNFGRKNSLKPPNNPTTHCIKTFSLDIYKNI